MKSTYSKKGILSVIVFFLLSAGLFAQGRMLYTGIVNYIPEDRSIPVIGLINIVAGDHESVQIGLFNHCAGSEIGFQCALLNQGTVNVRGAQTALINQASGKVSGAQIALLNTSESIEGVQVGLINRTKTIEGVQIGLINYSDSIKKGVPIGLLYFGKGAKLNLEVGMTEMHPFKVSMRTGVDKLYFILSSAYSPNQNGYVLLGAGVGTTIQWTDKLSLSPELEYLGGLKNSNNYDYVSLSMNVGIALSDRVGLYVGPSFGLNMASQGKSVADNPPVMNLAKGSTSSRLEQVVGLRAALRFDLSNKVSSKSAN